MPLGRQAGHHQFAAVPGVAGDVARAKVCHVAHHHGLATDEGLPTGAVNTDGRTRRTWPPCRKNHPLGVWLVWAVDVKACPTDAEGCERFPPQLHECLHAYLAGRQVGNGGSGRPQRGIVAVGDRFLHAHTGRQALSRSRRFIC